MPVLSIVLPCYNESGNIQALLARFRPLCTDLDFELILVDNGSTDDTDNVLRLELLRPENHFARTVLVTKNRGYGHGIQAGLRNCAAPLAAFSHADLQCPPESLKTAYQHFIRLCASGNGLVKGRRQGPRPLPDRLVTFFYNGLARLCLGIGASSIDHDGATGSCDINAQPKLFARDMIPALLDGPEDFTFDLYVLWIHRRLGRPVLEFDTPYEGRVWGKSKLAANPWIRIRTALHAFKKILSLRLARAEELPRDNKFEHPGSGR